MEHLEWWLIVLGLLIIFVTVAWRSRTSLFSTVLVTLLLLLVHELGLRWLANAAHADETTVLLLSLWKEAALAGLLVGALGRARAVDSKLALASPDWAILAFFVVGVASALASPNRLAGIAALRDYFEPMLLYLLGRIVAPSRFQVRWWQRLWLALLSIMAILAIWQGLAWGSTEYAHYGFGNASGQTGIPEVNIAGEIRIRPPSTVTGPNELALHMVLAVLLSASLFISDVRRYWPALGSWLLAIGALILTSSRSGFLALVISALVWGVLLARGRAGKVRVNSQRNVVLAALAGFVLLAFAMWLTGFGGFLQQTIAGLGGEYHVVDTLDALRYLVSHPAGVGMGLVGPRQGIGFPPVAAYHVEGSLWQVAMEMGVWGLAVFLIAMIICLRSAWVGHEDLTSVELRTASITAIAGWSGAMVAFLFLPLMQALPLMAWLWFLLGMACSAGDIEETWGADRRLSPQAAPTMPPPQA